MKNKDIEDKIPDHCVYITTNDFNRFLGTILQDRVLLKIKKERKITNIWFQLFFCKNNFLLLGEGLLMILMVVSILQRKTLVSNLVKRRNPFVSICIIILIVFIH